MELEGGGGPSSSSSEQSPVPGSQPLWALFSDRMHAARVISRGVYLLWPSFFGSSLMSVQKPEVRMERGTAR